jgi:hypothetical protein
VFGFKRVGFLEFTVSSREADRSRLSSQFASKLQPLGGLGRHAVVSVSQQGLIRIVSIGPNFTIDLQTSDNRMSPAMDLSIASRLFAVISRA